MKALFTWTAVLLLLAAACRKKEAITPGPDPEPVTPPADTTPVKKNDPVITNTAVAFHGHLSSLENTTDFFGNEQHSMTSTAFFTSGSYVSPHMDTAIYAGSVRLNGDTLTFNGPPGYIRSGIKLSAADTWSVAGAQGIPAFTFSSTVPRPSVDNLQVIPTAISKSAGVHFTITGVQNAKAGTFYISDGTPNPKGTIFRNVTNGDMAVSLTSDELLGLTSGTTGVIYLSLENSQGAFKDGKDFKFTKYRQVMKNLTVYP